MKIIIALNCDEIKVSDCDHLFLSAYNWYCNKSTGYYQCTSGGTWNGHKVNGKHLHWFISQRMGLEVPDGFEIDHIDRDKSNNQRPNLRIASSRLQKYNASMKKTNTSGHVGVDYEKRSTINPWVARIRINGKRKNLGCFKTPEEASEKYQAEKKIRDEKEIERVEKSYL